MTEVTVEVIREALEPHGLILRGGFHPLPDDNAPSGAATLLLVGNAGPSMWRAFEAARPGGRDPLNRWTRRVVATIAERFDATAIYPFEGPPYAPFFSWAKRAEPVHASPLGMMIHPEYGLWHAWRGALAFTDRLMLPATRSAPSPCVACMAKPCLVACPANAFREGAYDVPACANHLRTANGTDCVAEGCRARRACPIGNEFVYELAQAEFHMKAFLRDRPE